MQSSVLFDKIFGDAEKTRQWKILWVAKHTRKTTTTIFFIREITSQPNTWSFPTGDLCQSVSALKSHEALNQIGRIDEATSSRCQFRER
jgi:hypothetical protein